VCRSVVIKAERQRQAEWPEHVTGSRLGEKYVEFGGEISGKLAARNIEKMGRKV